MSNPGKDDFALPPHVEELMAVTREEFRALVARVEALEFEREAQFENEERA